MEADMTKRIGQALALAIVFCGVQVVAHDGHVHKIMGTVTARDAKHLEVKTPSGENLSIQIDEKTFATRAKHKISLDEVKKGARVVVAIGNDGQDQLPHRRRWRRGGSGFLAGKVGVDVEMRVPAPDVVCDVVVLPQHCLEADVVDTALTQQGLDRFDDRPAAVDHEDIRLDHLLIECEYGHARCAVDPALVGCRRRQRLGFEAVRGAILDVGSSE
jgi:hypothetical protein